MANKARGKVYNRVFTKDRWAQVNPENKNILDDFLMECRQRQKADSTIKQYKNDLRIVMIYSLLNLGNKSLVDCTRKDFRRFSLWSTEECGHSNARANRLMSAVRSLMDFLEEDDDYDYDNNVAKKIKGLPKEEVREIYFLSNEQIRKLADELMRRKDYQKATLLCLAYDSGGRRTELHQVSKDGFLEKNATNIVVGKEGKKFPLLYFDWTKEVAEKYLAQRGDDDIDSMWVVEDKDGIKREATNQTLYSWFVKMAGVLAQIEGEYTPFNCHTLRHSALDAMSTGEHYICSKMGKPEGFGLNELKVFAHHNSVDTTNSYLKNRDNEMLEGMFGISIE